MKRIQEIAKDNGLAVIEDASHATGARYYNTPVGSFGEAGCLDFYPAKPLMTGEGGMITTNDPHIAGKARILRSLAAERSRGLRYDVRSIGFTYRMSKLQATLGLHQLALLNMTNSVVKKKAHILVRELGPSTA